ncbi:MAG TPA: efflux RND transporter periplasmic adaptor subunit [Terracidiphilus sp.]|jgi:cobalt-zinc-cadmium efflux system membrane fusion protein
MNREFPARGGSCARITAAVAISVVVSLSFSGCKSQDAGSGAPPPARVIEVSNMSLISIPSADVHKFPIATAGQIEASSELSATGTVFPDVSREVPVISLANGRVVDIKTRLDDNVKKGQLLFSVQSPDVTNAFNAYLKAVNDEQLANKAYIRAEDLFKHGVISQAMLEQAEDAEKDAKADLEAADEQLKVYGLDKAHPSSIVHVFAPTTGVIIGQNVTNAAAAGVTLSGSATAFTIADLSAVWILCDVYENDIAKLQLGQEAKIKIEAYPDRILNGRISDIGPVLDPSLRTAKVRIEVPNPGIFKLGMFVTATFSSLKKQAFTVVPSDAVLHLHDRDWVYVPIGDNQFKRIEVQAGKILEGNGQEILSGVQPGTKVVSNALVLETAGTQ